MITSIEIINNKNTVLNYLKGIKLFKNGKTFKFKPGINIIIGPNGSGKSTLIELISQYLFCKEGMYSELPIDTFDYPSFWNKDNYVKDGVKIHHDYRGIIFRYRPASDYKADEHNHGIESFALMFESKSSSVGEQTMEAMGTLFKLFSDSKVDYNFPIEQLKKLSERSNPVWKERFENLIKYYQENKVEISKEDFQYTVLMDEPDRNLDVENILSVYNILSYQKPLTQMIAVVHNPALIYKLSKLGYINFIETKRGYLNQVKSLIEG